VAEERRRHVTTAASKVTFRANVRTPANNRQNAATIVSVLDTSVVNVRKLPATVAVMATSNK